MTDPTPNRRQTLIQGHIDVQGHVYLLNAEPDPSGTGWIARVGEYEATSAADPALRQIRNEQNQLASLEVASQSFTAHAPTEDAAIAALEQEIRTAVTEATRPS